MASSWLSSHWASACTDWLCSTVGSMGHGGDQLSAVLRHCHLPPPNPQPRTAQVDGQRGQDQAGQRQEAQQSEEEGVPGAGARGWRRHGAQRGQVRGTAGRSVQPGTGWSRAIPCSSRDKGVSACPQPPVPQPLALFLSPSVPLCPAEAQCRSLMDATGCRLMAPGSIPSESAGSAGMVPSALPTPSAGRKERGECISGTPEVTGGPQLQ